MGVGFRPDAVLGIGRWFRLFVPTADLPVVPLLGPYGRMTQVWFLALDQIGARIVDYEITRAAG